MIIKKNNHTVFVLPNNFIAVIIRQKLKKERINVTKKQALLIINKLKQYKKRHPKNWNFVEINEKNGSSIICII